MALAAYVNHTTADTAGTPPFDKALTGFGHQPKLWLPWFSLHTTLAGWSAADFEVGMGATAGAAAEMAHCLRMNDATTGGITRRGSEADSCVIGVNRNTNAEDGAYDLKTFDADGLTLNCSNTFGAADIIPYLSLGGSDISGADVLQIGTPTDAGLPYDRTYTFTGLTAAPTLLLVQAVGRASLGFGSTGAVFLGAADVNGQWAMMTKGGEANPTECWRIFRGDRCYAAHGGGASSIRIRAALSSFGFNGTNGTVTLTWDAVASTESQVVTLIALSGTFSHKVGVVTKATASPWTNTVNLGTTPRAAFVATAAMTTMGTPNDGADHCRGGVGIYDGTRARAISWQDEKGVATSNIAGYTEDDGTILAISDNATATSNDRLTPAFSGTDVVFTSAVQEAVAYKVGYVLLGDAGATTQTLTLPFVASASQVFAPSVSVGAATLSLPFVASTSQVFAPSLTAGPVTVTLPFVDSTSQVFAPTVIVASGTQTLTLPFVASASQTFAPSLSVGAVTLTLPFVASTGQLFAPTVVTGSAPAIVGGTQVSVDPTSRSSASVDSASQSRVEVV